MGVLLNAPKLAWERLALRHDAIELERMSLKAVCGTNAEFRIVQFRGDH